MKVKNQNLKILEYLHLSFNKLQSVHQESPLGMGIVKVLTVLLLLSILLIDPVL